MAAWTPPLNSPVLERLHRRFALTPLGNLAEIAARLGYEARTRQFVATALT